MEDLEKYTKLLKKAIEQFWETRNLQKSKQSTDKGNRSAVTGGKQLDGFIDLMKAISTDCGIPDEFISTKSNYLPGYFRPTKDWDFLITTLIWTNDKNEFGLMDDELSFDNFLSSFQGYLIGKLSEYKNK